MIKVVLTTEGARNDVIVDENAAIRQVLDDNSIDYGSGKKVLLDGATLGVGDIDKTFASFGITDKCYLNCIGQKNNA